MENFVRLIGPVDTAFIYVLTNRSSGKESGGMIPAPIKNPQKSLAALVSASFLLLALPRPT